MSLPICDVLPEYFLNMHICIYNIYIYIYTPYIIYNVIYGVLRFRLVCQTHHISCVYKIFVILLRWWGGMGWWGDRCEQSQRRNGGGGGDKCGRCDLCSGGVRWRVDLPQQRRGGSKSGVCVCPPLPPFFHLYT